jgi:hypothetical protein
MQGMHDELDAAPLLVEYFAISHIKHTDDDVAWAMVEYVPLQQA